MIGKSSMVGFGDLSLIFIVFVIFFFVGVLCFVLMLFSYIFGYVSWDEEKISSYECGFSPFVEMQIQFDIKFYLVALLFVVFDIEIILLYPWIISGSFSLTSIFTVFWFFTFILLGFYFEILIKALEWY